MIYPAQGFENSRHNPPSPPGSGGAPGDGYLLPTARMIEVNVPPGGSLQGQLARQYERDPEAFAPLFNGRLEERVSLDEALQKFPDAKYFYVPEFDYIDDSERDHTQNAKVLMIPREAVLWLQNEQDYQNAYMGLEPPTNLYIRQDWQNSAQYRIPLSPSSNGDVEILVGRFANGDATYGEMQYTLAHENGHAVDLQKHGSVIERGLRLVPGGIGLEAQRANERQADQIAAIYCSERNPHFVTQMRAEFVESAATEKQVRGPHLLGAQRADFLVKNSRPDMPRPSHLPEVDPGRLPAEPTLPAVDLTSETLLHAPFRQERSFMEASEELRALGVRMEEGQIGEGPTAPGSLPVITPSLVPEISQARPGGTIRRF